LRSAKWNLEPEVRRSKATHRCLHRAWLKRRSVPPWRDVCCPASGAVKRLEPFGCSFFIVLKLARFGNADYARRLQVAGTVMTSCRRSLLRESEEMCSIQPPEP